MRNSTRKIDIPDDFAGYNSDNFCNVGAAVVGGSVISGLMGANAAQSAASTQAGAATNAANAQLQATQETNAQQLNMYNQNVARQQPYINAGLGSVNELQQGMAPGGQFTQNFTPSQLNMDPSYQFRLNQGTQALNASAAANGTFGSGQNLKDITNYAQGAASQQYQQAFNNYQTQQGNLYNRLSGMATMSQNAATGVGTQGMQVATNMANNTMAGTSAANNYMTSGAAASAAGQMGSANAISGAISGGIGNYMGSQYMQSYMNNNQGSLGSMPNYTAGGTSANYSLGGTSGFGSPTSIASPFPTE